MKSSLLIVALIYIVSCKSEKKSETTQAASNSPNIEYYGQSIDTLGSSSVIETIEALKSTDSLNTKVTGYVTGVCQVKGCWMMLSQNPNDTIGLFVKFKNYGFFVPKELTGSKVTVAGKAFKEVTGVDELRHYAEDEGKSEEEIARITSPSEELKFMADGVALVEKRK